MRVPFARWRKGARRFSGASLGGKLETLRLLGWLAIAEGSLRLLPLETVCRWFKVRLGAGSPAPVEPGSGDDAAPPAPWSPELSTAIRAARARVDRVLRVARPHDACLRRSLLLGRELREHAPILHLGAMKREGQFLAHAWLEVRGLPVPDFGAPFSEPAQAPRDARGFVRLRAFSGRP